MNFPLRATFLALPLESAAKWQFQALQEELKPFSDILRFQNPQTPHLTLMYWPEVSQLEYDGIVSQAEKIATKHQPFTIQVTEPGTFGPRDHDTVLYLNVSFSDELARIKKACPWSDARPFTPHITVARIKHPQKFSVQKKKIMKVLSNCSFDVPFDRLRLYAQVEDVRQTPLQEFLLS